MASNVSVSVNELVDLFTKNGLIKECEKRGLSIDGTKLGMAERIVAFDNASDFNRAEDEDGEEDENIQDQNKDGVDNKSIDSESDMEGSHSGIGSRKSSLGARGHSARMFSLRDIDDSIEKFCADDSQDVTVWIDDFEEFAETLNWDDLQKYVACKKYLSGTAKKFVFAQSGLTNWRKLKRALTDEFSSKSNSADIHRKLMSKKKSANEKMLDYVYDMQRLAKMGRIDESTLCEYICDGICDSMTNKAILYTATTVSDLKVKLETYEKMLSKSKGAIRKSGEEDRSQKSKEVKRKNQKLTCYNCGTDGHRSNECPDREKGPKCFKCDSFNHIAKDCKKDVNKDGKGVKKVNIIQDVDSELDTVMVKVDKFEIRGVIDTYSDVSLIRRDLWNEIKAVCESSKPAKQKMRGFGGSIATATDSVMLNASIDGESYRFLCYIVNYNTIPAKMIIGRNFLQNVDYTITREIVSIKPCSRGDISLTDIDKNESIDEEIEKTIIDVKDDEADDSWILKIKTIDEEINVPAQYKDEVAQMIEEYNPEKSQDVKVKTKIILNDDEPVYQRPRRLAPLEKKVVDDQITEWLNDGTIRQSSSDFASPIALAKKKDNTYRVCIDYRELNKKVVRDRYPMPIVEDQLDRLSKAKVYTTLDLKNSYFHVPVSEESVKYTAFVTHNGQYEFTKTPFGLCISGNSFGRFINSVFQELMNEGILLAFVDDLIIPSEDEKDGISKLRRVLEVARKNGLVFNWKKCFFLQHRVEYLGYSVSGGNIKPSEDKVNKLLRYPIPTTTKQVQRFYGLASYFRKFVRDFAILSRPLSSLLKKNTPFEFGGEQLNSFNLIKNELSKYPVLKLFDVEDETEVHTDACKDGIAAILLQKSKNDGKMHPCHYYSRTTNEAEKNYHSYESEFLAVVEAMRKFRVYLLGVKFKLVTDCAAFKMTMSKKELHPKITRWALELSEFDFKIEHRPGEKMAHVDALSRANIMMVKRSDDVTSKVISAQNSDDRVKAIKLALESGPYDDYLCVNGVLYVEKNGKRQMVVPEMMQLEIITKAHEKGHFGVKKVKEDIEREFSIPNLEDKIKRCMSNCVQCILADRKKGKKDGELHPIGKGDLPLDTLHVDHLGPMPSTRKSYNYILTIVDAFSKFVWLFPVKATTSDETIKKLSLVTDVFGNPARIVADRGAAFTASQFKQYCQERGIELHHVATGVPRGNGQVERIHGIIIPTLTKLSIDKPDEWFKHVIKVQKCINSSHQRSIDSTPFEIMIGVKMRNPEDVRIMEVLEDESRKQFIDKRAELRKAAKQSIEKIQEENRRNYNLRSRKAKEYDIGDLVALQKTQFDVGRKVKPKFSGPYEVTKIFPRDRYELKKVGESEGSNKTTAAADLMKPWPAGAFGANASSGVAVWED